MPPSVPRPEAAGPGGLSEPRRGVPFQWNLLAWAALVGALTGLAIVGFHELLGLINNFLFGPFVDGLLMIGRSPVAEVVVEMPPPPPPASSTPLTALLQLGLGEFGFLPPAPPPLPEPPPPVLPERIDWLQLWPVVVVPMLGGFAVGLLRLWGGELGPGLASLRSMADGSVSPRPRLPLLRLVAASLSLGSGASLGPEGPSVESGGNIGLLVALRAGLSPEAGKTLVAAWAMARAASSLACLEASRKAWEWRIFSSFSHCFSMAAIFA